MDCARIDDDEVVQRDDARFVSPPHFWSTLGTVVLVAVALLSVYIVGGVLGWLAFVEPDAGSIGRVTLYAILSLVVPIAVAVRLRRRGRGYRAAGSIGAVITVAVSALFVPFVTVSVM
jgi:hypothetical protein